MAGFLKKMKKKVIFRNQVPTAIIFDETRITIRATNTKKY
jgi:hypothetical protein